MLEATPSAAQFVKRSYKILDYKCPGMLGLALPARCKVLKLDFQSDFLMSKIIQISLIFFSSRKMILGAHFLQKLFFGNIGLPKVLLPMLMTC